MHALQGLLVVVAIIGFFYMLNMTWTDWLNFGVGLFVFIIGLRVIATMAHSASIAPVDMRPQIHRFIPHCAQDKGLKLVHGMVCSDDIRFDPNYRTMPSKARERALA